jgi:CRP-like cAMP-binding protein
VATLREDKDKRALWYLRKIPLLAELPGEAIEALADKAEIAEVRRRKVLYLPGDPGRSVFFVVGGRVKVSKVTRDGKELTLAYLGPGDIFGELCLLAGGPREEMAEAVENALVTELDASEFSSLVARHAGLGLGLAKVLAARRRDLESKIERLIFRDVQTKLAELLLDLSNEYGVKDARGTRVTLKITHQEMANLIGSTRETVSLTLSDFRRRGLIQIEGRRVIIADPERLQALS